MSSRAKPTCPGVPWRDLEFSQPATNAEQSPHAPLCHPDPALDKAACAPFCRERRMKCNNAINLDRKFGGAKPTCPGVPWRELQFSQPATNVDQKPPRPPCHPERSRGDLQFSQPATNAEQSPHAPLCHPERSRPVPACRGGICSSLNQQQTLSKAPTPPFVIPSEADLSRRAVEGSAVLSTSNKC